MKAETIFPSSQQSATEPYPKPAKCSPYAYILFI
jgi:hypothetical protein